MNLQTYIHSMLITNNDELMVFSYNKQCHKFENGNWQTQNLSQQISFGIFISMDDGIYCFDGRDSHFLPNGKNEWQKGPAVPEPGISYGHGVAISPKELILVGGLNPYSQILKFNIESQKWTEFGCLHQERRGHRCFFFNGKIVVTGGFVRESLKSTEIIDVNILKSTEIIGVYQIISRTAGDLNTARDSHGMGIVTINGEAKLIVFGGRSRDGLTDSIEEWDDNSETWKMSSLKLSEPKYDFVYCQLPSDMV